MNSGIHQGAKSRSFSPALGIAALLLACAGAALGQTWTKVTNTIPGGAGTAVLLTDGSVLVHQSCTPNWYKLTPDSFGNYVSGTWSAAIPMQSTFGPLYFASAVLADGRVVATGGEYNLASCAANTPVDTNLAAIYNPATNSWTALASPPFANVGDAQSVILPNGKMLVANLNNTQIAQLDPATLVWSLATSTGKADINSEEGWELLPNGTLLAVDSENGTQSELYNPATGTWSLAGSTIVSLPNSGGLGIVPEVGPAVLRPDGTVYATGASGNNAVYNVSTGTWSASPSFPVVGGTQQEIADGPAALLPDGNVLVATSGFFANPTHFFEFNGTTLTPEPATPNAGGIPSFVGRMLLLPTGQVLFTDGSTDVEVYTPAGTFLPAWQPVITSPLTVVVPGTTYAISGLQFNGLSQAVAYGDDAQAATNYPLVRITNTGTGHVFYSRTHDHSTMAVATGATPVSTNFDAPAGLELGPSTLVVIANGIPSQPINIAVQTTAVIAPPTLTKAFSGPTVPLNQNTTLTFTIVNPNAGATLTGIGFTDTLPSGLTAVGPVTGIGCLATSLTFTTSVLTASGITLAPSATCVLNIAVKGATVGVKVNTTGAITSVEGGTGTTATATVTVVAPPTISKAFGPLSISVGSSTTLTFTITNPNAFISLTTIAFTDTLPAGLVVSTPNGLIGSCGGTVTAVSGSSTIVLLGGTLGPLASCAITVNVLATADASIVNSVTVTSVEGGTGNTATASIVTGAFWMRYSANLNSGDSVINLTNTGINGAPLTGPGFGTASGNLCVNVYAFSPDEQLVSCCSCLITPNGLASLSVQNDLISNTLTGVRPSSIVVKLVATGAGPTFGGTTCTNSAALAGTAAFPLAPGVRAWGTTIHAAGGAFNTTETVFSTATLSAAELASINNRCTNIIGNGSTFGICRSCRTGALGATAAQ